MSKSRAMTDLGSRSAEVRVLRQKIKRVVKESVSKKLELFLSYLVISQACMGELTLRLRYQTRLKGRDGAHLREEINYACILYTAVQL